MNTPKHGGNAFPNVWVAESGMSKRELMATLIMAGFAARPGCFGGSYGAAVDAVNAADNLLKVLGDTTQTPSQ